LDELGERRILELYWLVLWDEILSGGVNLKVTGLGELVTNVQVEKGYLRAVAKVHPDKVKLNRLSFISSLLMGWFFAFRFNN
jgi:hypothetical protein